MEIGENLDDLVYRPSETEKAKPEPVKDKGAKKKPESVQKAKEYMAMSITTYLKEYASITSHRILSYPIIARGVVVEVLSRTVNEDESWCKVTTPDGVTGYIQEKYLYPAKA